MSNRSKLKSGVISVIVVLALASLVLSTYLFVVNNPGGNDFYPRYLGTRLFLTQGLSPYSQETTEKIQQAMYGRPAHENEDQQLFVYPFYVMVFIAPFALVNNYQLARALWMSTSVVAFVTVIVLALRVVKWRPKLPMLGAYILFCVIWYHTIRPIINGNLSVIAALLVCTMLYCVTSGKDFWAGALMALATIKPQAVVLAVIWVLLWSASQKRWKVWIGFFVTAGILFGLPLLFDPGWIIQYIHQVFSYPGYTAPGTPAEIFSLWWGSNFGVWAGRLLNVAVVGLILWSWKSALRQPIRYFLWTALFTLALTTFTGIYTASSNYIILLPGFALLGAAWEQHWAEKALPVAAAHYLVMGLGLWGLFIGTLIGRDYQNPMLLFIFPAYMVIMLWVERERWLPAQPV